MNLKLYFIKKTIVLVFYLDSKFTKFSFLSRHRLKSKMPKRKSNLTCSCCSKILKDPIDLPCGEHLICHEHLADKDVVKENRIKCNDCNKEFQIKDNHKLKSPRSCEKC